MSGPLARQAVRGAIRELDDEDAPDTESYADDTPDEDDIVREEAPLQHSADPYSQQMAHMRNLLAVERNPQVRNQLELNIQDLMRARMRAGIR